MNKNITIINRFTTPIGPMFVCATDQGIGLLEFVDRRMLETESRDLQKLLNANFIVGENEHIKQLKKELKEYFKGERWIFDVQLHTPGSGFQKIVWSSLKQIPYGKTTTYKVQAKKLEKPKAIRAVASANGFDRVSVLIPCHRVIG